MNEKRRADRFLISTSFSIEEVFWVDLENAREILKGNI